MRSLLPDSLCLICGSYCIITSSFSQANCRLTHLVLPLTLAPGVLQKIAGLNPFAYAVDASRALVNGNPGDVAVLQAFAIFIVLTVLSPVWATRSMRQAMM